MYKLAHSLLMLVFFLCFQAGCSTSTNSPFFKGPQSESHSPKIDVGRWKAIQRSLNKLGYDSGVVDGIPGRRTETAIKKYQSDNAFRVTGTLSLSQEATLLESAQSASKALASNQNIESATGSGSTRTQSQRVSDSNPVETGNLEGRWASARIATNRRNFSVNLDWGNRASLSKYEYDFSRLGQTAYIAVPVDNPASENRFELSASPKSRRKPDPRKFYLEAKNGSASKYNLPRRRMEPLRSNSGIDILVEQSTSKRSGAHYLIRFRPTEVARKAGVADMGFNEFCERPGSLFAESAKSQSKALDTFNRVNPDLAAGFVRSKSVLVGMFRSSALQNITGRELDDVNDRTINHIMSRLGVCAGFFADRTTGDILGQALYGEDFTTNNIMGNAGLLTGKASSFRRKSSASTIRRSMRELSAARAKYEEISKDGFSSEISLDELAENIAIFKSYVYLSDPADVESEFLELNQQSKRLKRMKMEESDRTTPAKSQNSLVIEASKKYLLENCNKAALALRDSTGNAAVSLLTSSSVQAVGSMCTIESLTHILRFNISNIKSINCTDQNPTQCTFSANWSCRYTLNPSFGFSSDTVDIDVICPLVKASNIRMTGLFEKLSPSRWNAANLDW